MALQEGQQKCLGCSGVASGINFGKLTCENCTASRHKDKSYFDKPFTISGGTPSFSSSFTVAWAEQQKCVVCSDDADGIHFGALTCGSCRQFFGKGMKENHAYVCKSNKTCTINSRTRYMCKYCRYQKCIAHHTSREAIQMGRSSKMNIMSVLPVQRNDKQPNHHLPQQQQQKCVVCSDVANGIHFGALTCEGCKKFFRRGLKENNTYVCQSNKTCTINPRTRNMCRYCRYQKCIAHHMSREAIQVGRRLKLNVMSVLPVQKEAEQTNQQVALHLPQHQQQFQQQSQQQQQQSLQQKMTVLAHSSNSNAQNNFYMKQLSSNIDTNQHHYIGELLQVSKLDPSSEFATDDSKMRYSCGSDSRSMISYEKQNKNAGQPISYIINDKHASGDENKSYFDTSFTMSGGTQSFTSNFTVSWAGDMSQTLPSRENAQDDLCDTEVKMEQENYKENDSGMSETSENVIRRPRAVSLIGNLLSSPDFDILSMNLDDISKNYSLNRNCMKESQNKMLHLNQKQDIKVLENGSEISWPENNSVLKNNKQVEKILDGKSFNDLEVVNFNSPVTNNTNVPVDIQNVFFSSGQSGMNPVNCEVSEMNELKQSSVTQESFKPSSQVGSRRTEEDSAKDAYERKPNQLERKNGMSEIAVRSQPTSSEYKRSTQKHSNTSLSHSELLQEYSKQQQEIKSLKALLDQKIEKLKGLRKNKIRKCFVVLQRI